MKDALKYLSDEMYRLPRHSLSLSRKGIYISLFACLFIPIFFTAFYGTSSGSRGILIVGSLALSFSASAGWILLRQWEKKMQRLVAQLVQTKLEKFEQALYPATSNHQQYESEVQKLHAESEAAKIAYEQQINLMQLSLVKSQNEANELHVEMDKKLEEMRIAYLEFEDLRKEYHRLEDETTSLLEEGQKKLKHKDSLLNEYQRTIAEQRMIIEKKQRYIAKLEGKVRDLMYEIRTLLQLETSSTDSGLELSDQEVIDSYLSMPAALKTPYDYAVQLQKSIEKAENLTGVDHLGYLGGKSPRFLDPSLDSYAVDKRRLLDSFKDEMGGAFFVLSLVERKFIFLNPMIKTMVGWSPEKLMKDFQSLVVNGYGEWKEALAKLRNAQECSIKITILNKSGQPVPVDCYLGRISKGPFALHVLGLFVA